MKKWNLVKKLILSAILLLIGVTLGAHYSQRIYTTVNQLIDRSGIQAKSEAKPSFCSINVYNNCSQKDKDVAFNFVSESYASSVSVASNSVYVSLRVPCESNGATYKVCADFVPHQSRGLEPMTSNSISNAKSDEINCGLQIKLKDSEIKLRQGSNLSIAFPGSFEDLSDAQEQLCQGVE